MNKSWAYSSHMVCTLAFVGTFNTWAVAQEAGSNMNTPQPTETPTSLSAPGSTLEIEPAPAPAATSSSEPTIDAATTRKTFPNKPMLITGAVVLAGSYAAAVVVGATSDRDADEKLFIPVVGPWLDLNHRGCAANPCTSNKTLYKALLVGDGILQGIGAAGMLLSLVIPQDTERHWYLIGDEDLVVAPQFGSSTLGVGAAGRF